MADHRPSLGQPVPSQNSELPLPVTQPHIQKLRTKKTHLVVCFFLLVAVVVASVAYGRLGIVPPYAAKYNSGGLFTGRSLVFECDLISVDATGGQMVLNWLVTNDTACNIKAPTTGPECSAVNVYFDENLNAATTSSPRSNNVPTTSIFVWDPTTAANPRSNTPSFRTPIQVTASSSLQLYPFDRYQTQVFMFAQSVTTNDTVGVQVSQTQGIAVGFSVLARSQLDRSRPGDLAQEIEITRGAPVKAYAIIIVIATWAISLIFVAATLMHIWFGYAQKAEFLVIPIATLFTVTQLRGTMPGAPNFGTVLDYAGLLPCLALMSLCATLSIGALAFVEYSRQRKTVVEKILKAGRKVVQKDHGKAGSTTSAVGTDLPTLSQRPNTFHSASEIRSD